MGIGVVLQSCLHIDLQACDYELQKKGALPDDF